MSHLHLLKKRSSHMSRNRTEFNIYVSYNVEKLTETYYSRLDRLFTLLMILMGSAVFSGLSSQYWMGVVIVIVPALQLVYRFGEVAGQAGSQKHRYSSLMNRMQHMEDEELADAFIRTQERDVRPLSAIESLAFNKACHMRGQADHCADLNLLEKFLAVFIGANPCSSPKALKTDRQA
ncbi:hypothetical protein BTW07_04250 [Salinicola socius]|uniref:SMODS and SLOG-associating 2TM effector domain-containing protein n=2 Tax=Salinicola socius TaxID=404433 RepID=A0A1Q8SV19_9GAMM|nr:hypothetical protein BTW07_04250 [Salinicola socius]